MAEAFVDVDSKSLGGAYNNKNIVISELIGLRAKVLKCLDKKQEGLEGIVLDETKGTLLLDVEGKRVRVVKKTATFRFYAGSKSFVVEGNEINFRASERLEKSLKFYKKRKL
ncbi:MAG: ribonuclease P protein component 1 [Candidatus Micrarchaeia archaeon]